MTTFAGGCMASDNLDDFKLDGLDDLDLDMDDPFESLRSKSRIKSLTKGVLSGVKSELKSFGFIAKTIRKSIPDSFRRSLDNSDNIKFGVGNSYNKIAHDYKSEFNDLKSMMPDSIASLLPKGEEDYSYTHDPDSTEEENYTAGINSQLSQNERIANGRLKRDNNIDRMKLRGQTLQVEHLKGINDRLSAGLRSTSLGLRMAEKSLEIHFKHYNVALKTYELIHNSSKRQLRALADIIRNTSLSDATKHSIAMGGKRGVGGAIMSRFVGGAGKRMAGKAIETLSNRLGMISPLVSQIDMVRGMGDMINPWEMGGEVLGSFLAEAGGDYVSSKVKARLSKDSRLNKYGKKAGNISSSAMARARYATSKRFKTEYYMPPDASIGAQIKNWAKGKSNSLMDNLSGAFDGGLSNKQASNFKDTYNNASTASVHTNKSLTTIIPGYLARILREVTVLNTGNQNTGLMSYSIDRDRFVTDSRKNGDLIKNLKSVKKSSNTQDIRNSVAGMDPNNMLSASAKKAMEIQLLHGASNDMNFYSKNFTDSTYYHEGISKRDRAELIRFFRKNNFDGLEFNEASEALIDSTRSSKDDLDRMYMMMDTEIQKGNLDGLVTMGLVKRDSTGQPMFDEKAIYEFMLGTKGDQATFAKLMKSSKVRATGTGADNLKSFYAKTRGKEDTSGDINIKGFGEIKADITDAVNNVQDRIKRTLKGSTVTESIIGNSDKSSAQKDTVEKKSIFDKIRKMTLKDVLNTVDINNLSSAEDIDAATVRNISITDVLSKNEIEKMATAGINKEELRNKAIDYIKAKASSLRGNVEKAYTASKTYVSQKTNAAVDYGNDLVERARASIQADRDASRKSREDVNIESYQSSVLSLLRTINTASIATEVNTREIKVYVGNDIATSTTAGVRGGIPGVGSIRKLSRAGVDLVTKGIGMYGSMLGGLGRGGGSILGGMGNIAGDMLSSMTNIGRVKDIYLRDGTRKHPVMLARDIKAGMYIDVKTKKTIKKLKDIKGEVVDTEGNVVVKESELDKLYTLDGKSVIGTISGLVGGTMANLLKPSYYLAKGTAISIKAITGGYMRPKDIYVRGEKEPRMNAIGLKSGIYFNKTNGSVIKSVNDIKGPVIDFEGNEVVSARDLGSLVGANGKPIESLRYKIFSGIASIAVKPFKLAFQLGSSIVTGGFKALLKTGSIAKNAMGRMFGKKKVSTVDQAIASETNGILTAIYTLLNQRLPDPTRKWNDTDGDGYREGSFRDQRDDVTKSDKSSDDSNGIDPKKAGGMGLIASLMAKLKGKKDDESEDGDTFIDASSNGDDKDKKGKGKKPTTRMGKMWGGVKSIGSRFGGTALKFGALLGLDAIIGGGATALLAGGLGAAGTAIAGAAAAVLSVISLPVVVTVGAVAGAAVGGYYLYKYLSGRTTTFGDILTLRLAQYGVSSKNKEQVDAIIRLEGMLFNDTTIIGDRGIISTDDKKAAEIIKLFNINTRDPKSMTRWGVWFNQRFKPVYLAYIGAIKSIASNASLGDVDEKLSVGDKIRLLEYVNFDASSDGPMSVVAGPFGLGSIVHGAEAIAMRDDLIEKLNKMPKEGGRRSVNSRGRAIDSDPKKYIDTSVGTMAAINSAKPRQRGQMVTAGSIGSSTNAGAGTAKPPVIRVPNAPMKSNIVPISAAGGFAASAGSGNWGLPVSGAISSPFGMRNDPFSGKPKGHGGVDFAASQGTPIYATADGTVTRREYSQSYGNVVYINHGDGLQSRYAHMHSFNPALRSGDVIKKGTLVGYVGNTGHSKGNHLHFEIIDLAKNGKKLDPLAMINDREGKAAVKQLAIAEKEISNEVKESKSKDTIEGVNTLASTITKEPVKPPKDVVATDRLAQLTSIQTLNTETSVKIESRREQREFENNKNFQNSMDRAVIAMEEALLVSRNSNVLLTNINNNMGTVAKEIVGINTMRNNPANAIASIPKRPTTLSMDKLPVSNTRPV